MSTCELCHQLHSVELKGCLPCGISSSRCQFAPHKPWFMGCKLTPLKPWYLGCHLTPTKHGVWVCMTAAWQVCSGSSRGSRFFASMYNADDHCQRLLLLTLCAMHTSQPGRERDPSIAAGRSAAVVRGGGHRKPRQPPRGDDDDVFYLFLQKQKRGAELHIYLEEDTYHKRLFRGPNTNDMKK